MLGTVLWAKTVLAGVKASAVVLNRVLVAFIVCVQKIFFSWAPDFVDPSVSRNFDMLLGSLRGFVVSHQKKD